MDAPSGVRSPEATVRDRFVGSFNSHTAVVRLVWRRLLQLDALTVLLDAVFNPVLDVFGVVGVS